MISKRPFYAVVCTLVLAPVMNVMGSINSNATKSSATTVPATLASTEPSTLNAVMIEAATAIISNDKTKAHQCESQFLRFASQLKGVEKIRATYAAAYVSREIGDEESYVEIMDQLCQMKTSSPEENKLLTTLVSRDFLELRADRDPSKRKWIKAVVGPIRIPQGSLTNLQVIILREQVNGLRGYAARDQFIRGRLAAAVEKYGRSPTTRPADDLRNTVEELSILTICNDFSFVKLDVLFNDVQDYIQRFGATGKHSGECLYFLAYARNAANSTKYGHVKNDKDIAAWLTKTYQQLRPQLSKTWIKQIETEMAKAEK